MVTGKAAGAPKKPRQKAKKTESETKTEVASESPPIGHNGPEELTDDQLQALFFQHKKQYEQALAVKKKADADLRNCAKMIKAEGGAVSAIKKAISLDTPEGEAKVKADVEETMRIARWLGASLGDQLEFFEDRTPVDDRAFAEGKRASLKGEPRKPPHDPSVPQYQAWLNGYAAGQDIIMKGFKPIPAEEKAGGPVETPEGDPVPEGGEKPWPDDVDVQTGKVGTEDPTFTVN